MKANATNERIKRETILKIAREVLDIETLEPRKMDRLDFHDVAVWQVAKALEAAYEAGRSAGPRPKVGKRKTTARPRP